MGKRALPHIVAIAVMFVWGITFVSTKVLLDYLSPFHILLARTILAFVALCVLRPRIMRVHKPSHEVFLALAGLTGAVCYYLAENTALQYADASFVSVAISTAPLFTALLSFAVLKEEGFGARFVVGSLIAFAGVVIISFQGGPGYASPEGVLLCLVGAVAWAIYSIIVKRLANLGYETIATTKRIFAWALVYMVIFQLAAGGSMPLESLALPVVWGNLLFLGVLASAACFVGWNYSVKHIGPAATSVYIYAQPAITVLFAVILLSEPFTALIALGIVLVVVGLALSERRST